MLRTCPGVPRSERPPRPPQFDLRSEFDLPGFPVLCVLTRRGDRVEAMVNTAFGDRGYLHAAWHTEQGLDGTLICQPGVPCGYAGDT